MHANFTGAVLAKTCRLMGIEKSKISSYHSEGNAKVERIMRTILDMLSKYLDDNHTEWDVHLPLLMLGYRAQIHSSLGYSPYYLMFGREPKLPAEASLSTPVATSSSRLIMLTSCARVCSRHTGSPSLHRIAGTLATKGLMKVS